MKQKNNLNQYGRFLQKFSLLLMVIVLVAVFACLNEKFLTLSNFQNIIEQNGALAIVAVGVTFAVIAGNMDLSPGAAIALVGVVFGLIFRASGSIALSLLGGALAGLAIGLFNGFIIARLKVNPVIVTLAAMIWARGLALALTEKDSIVIQSPFIDFMNTRFLGLISPPMIIILLSYILGSILLNNTRLGRYTFAIGGDERSAKESGVRVDNYKMAVFLLGGFFVSLAAFITVGRQGAATPNAVYGLELDAIVAVIIGGSKLSGGEGSIRQTIIGVLFLSILNNGLSTLGMRDAHFYFYKGIVILLALTIDVISSHWVKQGNTAALTPEPAMES